MIQYRLEVVDSESLQKHLSYQTNNIEGTASAVSFLMQHLK